MYTFAVKMFSKSLYFFLCQTGEMIIDFTMVSVRDQVCFFIIDAGRVRAKFCPLLTHKETATVEDHASLSQQDHPAPFLGTLIGSEIVR